MELYNGMCEYKDLAKAEEAMSTLKRVVDDKEKKRRAQGKY